MKMGPVYAQLAKRCAQVIVHTGQHYDWGMSGVFFEELGIPHPTANLEVGPGTHAAQTAKVMERLEPLILEHRPRVVVVYGDVNSTLASALVCSKLLVPVAHVEAGLRSGDRTMPEEINRIVTDTLSDVLFTPSADANANLEAEGIPSSRIVMVGNVMIDTLVAMLPKADPDRVREACGIHRPFALVTLHRPSNVDRLDDLRPLLSVISELSETVDVVFPVHPRTRQQIERAGITMPQGVRLIDPLSYLDFLSLERAARLVITDSGGIQEETTYLGVPCITVRTTTERPITITQGTNVLTGPVPERIRSEAARILAAPTRAALPSPPLWDGHAADRIADVLEATYLRAAGSKASPTFAVARS